MSADLSSCRHAAFLLALSLDALRALNCATSMSRLRLSPDAQSTQCSTVQTLHIDCFLMFCRLEFSSWLPSKRTKYVYFVHTILVLLTNLKLKLVLNSIYLSGAFLLSESNFSGKTRGCEVIHTRTYTYCLYHWLIFGNPDFLLSLSHKSRDENECSRKNESLMSWMSLMSRMEFPFEIWKFQTPHIKFTHEV